MLHHLIGHQISIPIVDWTIFLVWCMTV